MGRDPFVLQRSAGRPRDGQVPSQEIVETAVRKRPAALVQEDRVIGLAAALFQPRAEGRDRVPAQRDRAFLPPLAVTADMSAVTKADVAAAQGDDLRAPHTGLQRHQQQAVVASPDPAGPIRRPEESLTLRATEEVHLSSGIALGRYGQDPLSQGCMLRFVQGDITEQGPDCRQAGIAGTDVVAALVLEMIEKVADQVGVEILERQIMWRLAKDLVGIVDEQPERVAVAGDGVGAHLALLHEVPGEEQGQQLGKVGDRTHELCLPCCSSRRRAASAMSSGTAVRYQ